MNFLFNNLKAENDFVKERINKRFQQVFNSGIYLNGDQAKYLENKLCEITGNKYCLTVKNATDAISMLVKYILITRPKAAVILPNFGAYATAIAVKNHTSRIEFVDVDDSYTININKLPDVYNGIIIPVHLFGNNCKMVQIMDYAKSHNHIVIEDCAQSLGSGSGVLGDYSVFSFYPTKPLGTIGDGGAICTNYINSFSHLIAMKNYGLQAGYIFNEGVNSRMGELECAVVNAKIEDDDIFNEFFLVRRGIAERYKKYVKGMAVNKPCVYHQFPVRFKQRDKIIRELNNRDIPYMIHYELHISDMPVFKYLQHEVGFRMNETILSLPCNAFMEDWQKEKVYDFLFQFKSYECD